MTDCIFCKIITGDISSSHIYEDEETYAFLDINPNNPGHALVVPKEHSRNIFDISLHSWVALMKTVHLLAPAIKKATEAAGVNVHMNNESAAFQEVFHTHVHIIPRHDNDGFTPWGGTPYKSGEEEAMAERIRAQL